MSETTSIVPAKENLTGVIVDNVAFLLDRELRHSLVAGRKSRAKACADRIHAMGLKTETEREEEAEAERVAKLKVVASANIDED